MIDPNKNTSAHLRRAAIVYIRQSTTTQVESHRESTARQYALAERARELGWKPGRVTVIDQDLGLSGVGTAQHSGHAQLTTEVALGHVGVVMGLKVSRLARNNAEGSMVCSICAQ